MDKQHPHEDPPPASPEPSPSRWARALSLTLRVGLGLALLVASVAVFQALLATAPQVQRAAPAAGVVTVRVFDSFSAPVQRQWRGFGQVAALVRVEIPSRVAGVAAADGVPADLLAGKPVSAGNLVVQLDASDFIRQETIATQALAEIDARMKALEVERRLLTQRLALEREDARLAEQEFERITMLRRDGSSTQTDLDRARRAFILAERTRLSGEEQLEKLGFTAVELQARRDAQAAQLATAQANRERCRIETPISGFLESVSVKSGENIPMGHVVARVVNLDRVEVMLNLPAAARQYVAAGDHVEVRAMRQQSVQAKVTRVSPANDPATRTVVVYAEVDQKSAAADFAAGRPAALLTPGAFVEAVLTAREAEVRSVVPRGSFRRGTVVVVRDGVLQSMPASAAFDVERVFDQSGLDTDQWVALEQRLPDGLPVLISPSVALLDGQAVRLQRNGVGAGGAARPKVDAQEASP